MRALDNASGRTRSTGEKARILKGMDHLPDPTRNILDLIDDQFN